MNTAHALSVSAALGYAILGVAHLFTWRTLRQRRWAWFATSCALAALFFLIELRHDEVPPPSTLGLLAAMVPTLMMLQALAAYFELPRAWRQRLLLWQGAVSVTAALLMAAGRLDRLGAFLSYDLMLLSVVAAAVWQRRRARWAVVTSLLLYSLPLALAATGLVDPLYLRFLTVPPLLAAGSAMLIEGLLIQIGRAHV